MKWRGGVQTVVCLIGILFSAHLAAAQPAASATPAQQTGTATTDDQTITRFKNEVQATARLSHPNTVEIYDYGVTNDGMFFYVMEYLPGLSVQELVERTGPLPAARVIHLLRQVCQALNEAHRAGLRLT